MATPSSCIHFLVCRAVSGASGWQCGQGPLSLSAALAQQVCVDVDGLDGTFNAGHGESLLGLRAEGSFAVGDQPAFRPEWVGRCVRKGVKFAFLDCCRYAIFEAAGLALDGNVSCVATSHGHDVDADVLIGGAGGYNFAVRPFRSGPAPGDVPLLDVRTDGCGEVLRLGFHPVLSRRSDLFAQF